MARPRGVRVPLLDLCPGDRARLPLTGSDGELGWSEPVTITSLVLLDTGLVQVRWDDEHEDGSPTHLLVVGPAFDAGAVRLPPLDPPPGA